MKAAELRCKLMRRDTQHRLLIEPDPEFDPRDDQFLEESGIAKFTTGEYRAWIFTIYVPCVIHDNDCAHRRIKDVSGGIDVHDDVDLAGEYTSPYFIPNGRARAVAWDMWPGPVDPNDYIEGVLIIADSFRYELCSDCGGDLDRHVISPGPFGYPFAWCMTETQD